MKRRILSLLLVLALTVGLLPAVQAADSFQLTYKEISAPTGLEITGFTGTMPQKLVIPETIDGKSVVAIGEKAFEAASLEELVLPGSVKKIGEAAFRNCASLRSAVLASVETIDDIAFSGCKALKEAPLPDTLTEMGVRCFTVTGLTDITIPGGVKTIPTGCFDQGKLRHVAISEGVETISKDAFCYCPLEGAVILPKSLTSVSRSAFSTKFGEEAPPCLLVFLSDVTYEGEFPRLTVRYGQERPAYLNPWDRCVLADELPYEPTAETFAEGPLTYCICDGIACVLSCTAAGDYTMPDTLGGCPVGVIGPFAFFGADELNRLTLPDSITDICRGAFYGSYPIITRLPKSLKSIGEAAFYSQVDRLWKCVTFVDGTIPDGVTVIPDSAFHFATFTDLVLPAGLETIGGAAFYAVLANSITFSGSVREIKGGAFGSVRTDTIELPEGLEIIGDSAFQNLGTLKTLYLPHSLKECSKMFGSYPSTDTIVYGYSDTPAYACCTEDGITFIDRETGEVSRKPYLTTLDGIQYYVRPGQYAEIRDVVVGCPEDVIIPETVDGTPVTTIFDWAFSTDAVRSVYLPDTVTTLYDMAFIDCTNLESLRLSENLESIGDSCFRNCPKLKFLYFPASVSSMQQGQTPIDSTTVALFEAGTYAQSFLERRGQRTYTLDPDEDYISEGDALCRIEGDTAVLVALCPIRRVDNTMYFAMPDTVAGYPITAIDGDVELFDTLADSFYLGRNVTTVGEGALRDTEVRILYTYPALTSLPGNIFSNFRVLPPEIYGFAGSYAEEFCKENSIAFHAIDSVPFTDVPEDSWYYPWVFTCYWSGYMNGTSATTFSPGGVTSRAMLVTVLYRMCGQYVSDGNPFYDVPYNAYYYDPVCWAQACGVVYGTSATTFSPDAPVTREQTATILYRLASLMGLNVDSYTPLTRFIDGDTASEYARSALMWAVDAGILQGNDLGELNPRGNTTRAQMAAIIVRYVNWLVSEGLR